MVCLALSDLGTYILTCFDTKIWKKVDLSFPPLGVTPPAARTLCRSGELFGVLAASTPSGPSLLCLPLSRPEEEPLVLDALGGLDVPFTLHNMGQSLCACYKNSKDQLTVRFFQPEGGTLSQPVHFLCGANLLPAGCCRQGDDLLLAFTGGGRLFLLRADPRTAAIKNLYDLCHAPDSLVPADNSSLFYALSGGQVTQISVSPTPVFRSVELPFAPASLSFVKSASADEERISCCAIRPDKFGYQLL